MTLFDKLTNFRRLASEVLFFSSEKEFEQRLMSHLASFNIDSSYSIIRLRKRHYSLGYLCLADSFSSEAVRIHRSAIITVFFFSENTVFNPNLYYTISYV